MEKFVIGTVVVIPFPFSDLSSIKRRPALVLANLIGDDYIVCQISRDLNITDYSISLKKQDFSNGFLSHDSYIRTNKLFTIDKSLILYSVGTINILKLKEVLDKVSLFFKYS